MRLAAVEGQLRRERFGGGEVAGSRAREQVREAADAIVSSFEGSAPRLNLALALDEESGCEDGGGDDGGKDWDEVVSGPGTP